MVTLGDHDGSEKGRVAAVILLTLLAMAATATATALLELDQVCPWIGTQPGLTGLFAAMALWGGVTFLLLRGVRVATFVVRLAGQGALLGASLLAKLIAGALKRIAAGLSAITGVLREALAPLFEPVRFQWLLIFAPLRERMAPFARSVQKERTLWRAYRTEFKGRFRSYLEFRRYFESKGAGGPGANAQGGSGPGRSGQGSPAPARDPFSTACSLIGLPADGKFTESEFTARYRALMKGLHPDVAGPNELAAQVNAACGVIKKRKGWS
jgi:hypothetical protein